MPRAEFIKAIENKTKVRLTFVSKEDNCTLTRLCAPMDFGPSRRAKNKDDRYHLWDYESDKANHVLSLLPAQIVNIEFLDMDFNPAEFVSWPPNWLIKRDWGVYS
ncbi:hypothetical protein ABT56_22785 [Photobacterium aquae]|uniref:WYL domain-containing protein n=1 Tax=Photobacterium aquae TaxID=1195763 RepID=A0A0J1GJT6_9GAMM|nr:hypothetical protein [Photobacterium aquae]KLU99949.1 hypothetical protein ABT56_22785 [Photobacterium aquae]